MKRVTAEISLTLEPEADLDLLMAIFDAFAKSLESGPCSDVQLEVTGG